MTASTSKPRKPKTPASQPPAASPPGVIETGCVYTLDEAAKRLRWRTHAVRQARRAGLQTVKFGSRRYVSGAAVIAFFESLADDQGGPQ